MSVLEYCQLMSNVAPWRRRRPIVCSYMVRTDNTSHLNTWLNLTKPNYNLTYSSLQYNYPRSLPNSYSLSSPFKTKYLEPFSLTRFLFPFPSLALPHLTLPPRPSSPIYYISPTHCYLQRVERKREGFHILVLITFCFESSSRLRRVGCEVWVCVCLGCFVVYSHRWLRKSIGPRGAWR